jgi:deoxyadenosine/deoxycytidine kinase
MTKSYQVLVYETHGGIGVGKTEGLETIAAKLNERHAFNPQLVPFHTVVAQEPVHLWENTPVIGADWKPTEDTMNTLALSYNAPDKYRVPMQYGVLASSADRYDPALYMHLCHEHECNVVVLMERGYADGKAFIDASGDLFDYFTRTMYAMYLKTLGRLIEQQIQVIGKCYWRATAEVQMSRIVKRSRKSEIDAIELGYLVSLNVAMDNLHAEAYEFDANADRDKTPGFYDPVTRHICECYNEADYDAQYAWAD